MTENIATSIEYGLNRAEIPLSPQQFGALYDTFATPIYRHIKGRVGSREDAEDITGKVFLQAWDRLSKEGQSIENVRAFLYKIAHNAVTDHYRKKRSSDPSIDAMAEDHAMFAEKGSVHATSEERETLRMVEGMLMHLDGEYKAMIVWRYVDELSIEEISELTGKNANAVYVTIHRALKKLRLLIAEKGW